MPLLLPRLEGAAEEAAAAAAGGAEEAEGIFGGRIGGCGDEFLVCSIVEDLE